MALTTDFDCFLLGVDGDDCFSRHVRHFATELCIYI